MGIVTAFSMTLAYGAVCAFFTALVIGMWYGVVAYIRENLSILSSSNHTKKEKVFKLLSFCTMVFLVLGITATNVVFWTNTPNVFNDLSGRSICNCPDDS